MTPLDILKQVGFFALLVLAQALVLGRIHLFGYATPLLYVYMALVFPLNYPKWATLLWCFAIGLATDTFTNTPGVASASMTLIGALQPYYAQLFVPRDSPENLRPSFRTFGATKFSFFVSTLTLLYCIIFFSIEMFNFWFWTQWLWCVLGSSVVTVVLILTIESVRRQ